MIQVAIITNSDNGLAANCLPLLLESKGIKVVAVIVSQSVVLNKRKYYEKKLKKVLKIGVFGTLNGYRMRKWYNEEVRKLHQPESLKEQCNKNKIEYHLVQHTNSSETVAVLQKAKVDLGLSLGNGYISKKVFSIPEYGMINIHHEILPDFQNAQSVIWQLYEGSRYSGYTIHKIDNKIDTGEILYKEEMPIQFEKSLQKTVTNSLFLIEKRSALTLVKVLEDFEFYFAKAYKQGKGNHYTTPSLMQFIKIYSNYRKLRKLS